MPKPSPNLMSNPRSFQLNFISLLLMLWGLTFILIQPSSSLAKEDKAFKFSDRPATVILSYRWQAIKNNFSGKIQEHYTLTLSSDKKTYHVQGLHANTVNQIQNLYRDPRYPKSISTTATIPRKSVSAVTNQLNKAHWVKAKTPVEAIDPKKGYSTRTYGFQSKDGKQIELISTSNTPYAIPWNMVIGETLYTTTDTEIAQAIFQLFQEVMKDATLESPSGAPPNKL